MCPDLKRGQQPAIVTDVFVKKTEHKSSKCCLSTYPVVAVRRSAWTHSENHIEKHKQGLGRARVARSSKFLPAYDEGRARIEKKSVVKD